MMNKDLVIEKDYAKEITIPMPYAAYDVEQRLLYESFETYKNTIINWVAAKTVSLYPADLEDCISDMFIDTLDNKFDAVGKKLFQYSDKVRILKSFTGLAFGVQIYEDQEKIEIRTPMIAEESDLLLYPGYNEVEFKKLNIIEKIDWMYEHCLFIPICLYSEDLYDGNSHKYSHIKRNNDIMEGISAYLESMDYPPADDIYYFIEKGKKGIFLKRDNNKSPKKSKDTSNN